MRLKEIRYSQFEGSPQEWVLSGLQLGQSNLIVGKNATGKTRSLNIINSLAMMLVRKKKADDFASGKYDVIFDNEGEVLRYQLEYAGGEVSHEIVTVGGTDRLVRGAQGIGKIFHEKEGKDLDFQTPESNLAAVARRDSIQHK